MEINYQIISAFSSKEHNFKGNPAAVIISDQFPEVEQMRRIAKELQQPATTFLVPEDGPGRFFVRWFAPDAEIGLCGHGSAAATAYLATANGKYPAESYELNSPEGMIKGVLNPDQTITLSLAPIELAEEIEIPLALREGLGIPLQTMYKTHNKHLIIADSQADIQSIKPDYQRLRDSDLFGYAVTAKGDEVDFVSRTFVPHTWQKEDYATGSSHAILVPYWAKILNKNHLQSLQLSERGGAFDCRMGQGKVFLTGEYTPERPGKVSLV
ncbi:isomerase [Echinicola pacifica]|uniref:Isomerase n=1 Tax=Echinicola pacifica TaxID=346377 RepID=A0A918PNS8_9BACT|nr:PhzF family phenazine biosynthesis protein [Echinicola pacifica]GGZ15268.1 isomerase [Echinicola pacifica]